MFTLTATPAADVVEHVVAVEFVPGRYPYRPTCSCGHPMWGYVARHAAEGIAEAHAAGLRV